jgi:creatinine amidohydrolase
MASFENGLMIADLSWPEMRDALDAIDLVLLPIGSNEQHGPNLSLKMDTAAATEFCRRASARMQPRVAVAPPPPWGVSFHHMNFPGTITLSTETFTQVLVEIVGSLVHHGLERFLIVNGHGGNVPAMNVAIVRVREEFDVSFVGACTYVSFVDAEVKKRHDKTGYTGHACEFETALAMELIPDVVKSDALAPGDLTELMTGFRGRAQKYGVTIPYRFDEYTRNGALGDATQATPDAGKEMVDNALDNFVAFCDALITESPEF